MNLPILYQDRDLVVVSKPAGLLVHRTGLDRHARHFAMQIVRDQVGASVYPVHRLDRPTSGALVFALSKAAARSLVEEFSGRRVRKNYLAVVRGIPRQEFIALSHPLKEELDKFTDAKARHGKLAQEAVTEVQKLGEVEFPVQVDRYPTSRYALVRATPLTGRKHQIRRHLRHLGHPVIGDITHGVGKHNRFFAEHLRVKRLLLACTEISFRHPTQGVEIKVKAPLAQDFADVLHQVGWGRHVDA